ncbi:MAG: hypothetical protein JWR02_1160 [Mucilaginibacter sp.]|nr:hypothetical protein [Mucilaginibacter sp.]
MNFSLINWLAVVAAALSAFLVGGLWYSKTLFRNAWMTDSKLTTDEIKSSSMGKTFGFTALFSLIMAANLAMFLADAKTDAAWGAEAGCLAGIWTFCAIAIHSLFELKSWRHILINGGYSLVSLTLMGAIIGWWR